MRRRGSVLWVCVIACVLGHANAARADDPPAPRADERARAQELFDSALADAQRGDFATACPKFRASQEADPKTSTLLNLGNCYEKNGQIASAWGAFKEASVRARNAGRDDWATMAESRISVLEPQLAHVTVQVPPAADAPGLVVTRDGAKVLAGERGVPIPVDAGEHVFTASADGKIAWSTTIKVTDTQPANVEVPVLEDAPKPPPPPPPPQMPDQQLGLVPPPPYWTTWRIVGVSAAGAGVVAMGVGAVLGVTANSTYKSALAKCQNGDVHACPPDAVTDSQSAHDRAGVATGVFIGGAAFVAAGAALFFLAPEIDGRKGQIQVVPAIGGGGAPNGFVARGTF